MPIKKNALVKGDTGAAVKEMQKKLIKLGFSCGVKGADGSFGSNTEKAVIAFQKANKLVVDGKYGPKTSSKLTTLYNEKITKTAPSSGEAGANLTTPSKGITAQDVLNVMRSWIGLSRSAGTHKVIIDTYNSYTPRARGYKVSYTDAYCDATISAAFIKLNAVSLIGGTECGVEKHVAIFKNKGIWDEDGTIIPKPGYIIVFNWNDNTQPNDSWSDHIGIVEKVENGKITTIEGNMKNGVVGRRIIPVGWGFIRGYAKPNYANPSSNKTTTNAGSVSTSVSTSTATKINIAYAKSFNKNLARHFTTTSKVNLRAGASTSNAVITTIPKDTQVLCYGYYTGDWYYIVYGNLTGFCHRSYLK